MDKKQVINILILADAGANAEQLVNLLRIQGLSVNPQRLGDLQQLQELLGQRQWDLLLLLNPAPEVTSGELSTQLQELDSDLAVLQLFTLEGDELPSHADPDSIRFTDPDDPQQQAALMHRLEHELEGLQTRRELRRSQASLRDLEQRYRLLMASTSDAISYLHDGVHVYANAAYMELFGYHAAEEMISVPLLDLVAEQDVAQVKEFLRNQFAMDSRSCAFQALRKDGMPFPAELDAAAVPYEGERVLQLLIRPASGNTQQRNAIRQIHNRDLLTGLLNRASMLTQIEHAIGDAIYEQRSSCLLLLQLQHLDEVSMVMGKSATNLLLADIGSLLHNLLPEDVLGGRISTSELAVLIPDAAEREQDFAERLAEAVNDGLRPLLPQTLQLFALAGTAAVTESSSSADVVLERARYNIAVQRKDSRTAARRSSDSRQTQKILQNLRKSLESGDFVLAFQPVVSLNADGLEHYELRIRMPEQQGSDALLLYPPDFLGLANQQGLGEEIDRWVLSQALALLQQRNNSRLRLTVNLTQNSIMGETLLPWLVAQLHSTRQLSNQLILQVSELDIVSTPERIAELGRKLEELDIRLSVTHFGCSLEPLQNLERVHAHFVKLDRALLQDLDVDNQQARKLQDLVKDLHDMGLLVIAPMIDRMEMLPQLWQAGINMVQGNCLQEPSDSMDFSFLQDEEITLRSFS